MTRDNEGRVHQSRSRLFSKGSFKAARHNNAFSRPALAAKKQLHDSSVNLLKKRIRDLTRKLNHKEDLPADVRRDDERALATYEQELAAAEALKHKQKTIGKYHMVRFFERQKASRTVKRLQKQLAETDDANEREMLEKLIHMSEIDLNYALYFPLSETYVSMYQKPADGQKPPLNPSLSDSRPPLWAEIERRTALGKNDLQEYRDGSTKQLPSQPKRHQQRSTGAKLPPVAQVAKKQMEPDYTLNRRERRRVMGIRKDTDRFGDQSNHAMTANEDRDENMSDGGFFEEE